MSKYICIFNSPKKIYLFLTFNFLLITENELKIEKNMSNNILLVFLIKQSEKSQLQMRLK